MRRWVLALAVAGALGGSTGSAGTLQDGGRIVLSGEGSGIVHYVAEGPGIPGGYEDDCPEACSVTWPLQGATITLTATPREDSRFGGWGGLCAAAGTNRTCTFTGTAGVNVVEARFLPPKIDIAYVPIRGTTTLQLTSSFVQKLRRQGWRLQAIAPATLHGKTLRLPIARQGTAVYLPRDLVAAGREVCPRVLRHSQSRLHGSSLRRYPSLSPGWEPQYAAARQAGHQLAHRLPQFSLPRRA